MSKLRQFITKIDQFEWSALFSTPTRILAGAILVVIVLAVLAQIIPVLQVDWSGVSSAVSNNTAKTTPAEVAALENEMRETFLKVLGGIVVVIALYFTYRRVKVAEQGHITDRYTKAIEQLGAIKADKDGDKPNVEVRLGAIYALERIAQDSPRDHWTIMEVLTAYVRQNAPAPTQQPTEAENKAAIVKGPSTEIQAILTVLGRRRRDGKRENGQRLDLCGSDLRGADFFGAHLERAWFIGAHLDGAKFVRAHLDGAIFFRAHLERAWFDGAHLDGADFVGAHLDGALFSGAVSLTVEQFERAHGWEKAKFDEEFLQKLKAYKAKQNSPQETTPAPEKSPDE